MANQRGMDVKQANGIMVSIMRERKNKGFTLLELAFAMSFLAFIMVFVVVVLMQIMNIYNKGVAMTQINQTGRQLADDLNTSVRFASSAAVDFQSDGKRLCTGQVSYIWNSGADTVNTFSDGSAIGVVRVKDSSSTYCSDTSLKPSATDSNVSVLAGASVSVLEFTVIKTSSLVRVVSILSTSGANKPIQTDGKWTCLGSGGSGVNPYCSFTRFDNVIYMRGGR